MCRLKKIAKRICVFFSFLSFFSLFSLCAPLIPFDPWASGCMGLVESLGHTQNPTTAAYGVEERVEWCSC